MTRLLLVATAALVATSACAKNIAVTWAVSVREALRRPRRVTDRPSCAVWSTLTFWLPYHSLTPELPLHPPAPIYSPPARAQIPTNPQTITAAKGDTVTFTWTGNHNVYQVADAAKIGQCDFAAGTDLGAVSPVTFTMGDKAVYFGCQIPGHCGAGQKLTVTPEATPAPTWEGTSPAYKYTDALCTSGKGATPVSTTTKSVRSSATTACITVGVPDAGSTKQFFRQTCAAGATTYTQQSCDGADCGVCDGALMTYTIEKSLMNAGSGNYMGYCV